MAMPLASAGKTGMSASQPGGSSPRRLRRNSCARSGKACAYAAMRSFHAASARAPRASASRKCASAASGNQERRLGRPAEVLLGQAHFVDAERRAVRLEAVLLVRRAVADVRAHQDQRRPRRFRARSLQRGVDRGEVVAVRRPTSCASHRRRSGRARSSENVMSVPAASVT